jgi:prevent-host-death family protein
MLQSGLVWLYYRMTITTVTEAKANLSKLLAFAERGEEMVIGRAGKPIAMIVPYKGKRKPRQLGLMAGMIHIARDFDEWPDKEARALGIID